MQQLRRFDTSLLDAATVLVGSARKLARKCGVATSAITNARMRGTISPELALRIHKATKGRVPASSLRPDMWLRPGHVPIPRKKRTAEHQNGS